MENRRYCTYCAHKKNESKMILLWYPLLRRKAWHCLACFANFPLLPYKILSGKLSSSEDKTQKKTRIPQ